MRRDAWHDTYAPQAQKTFKAALTHFIQTEFPRFGGPRVIELFTNEVQRLVERFYLPRGRLQTGQLVWTTVAKEERPTARKRILDATMSTVVLTRIAPEDIGILASRHDRKAALQQACVRMCKEADAQGGTLSETELALLVGCSPTRIGQLLREYEARTGEVVPRRGTVHDLGRSVSHKALICRKAFCEGLQTPEIARLTHHSPEAVDQYLLDCMRVRYCLEHGLSLEATAFSTGLSLSLVREYQTLLMDLGLLNGARGGESSKDYDTLSKVHSHDVTSP